MSCSNCGYNGDKPKHDGDNCAVPVGVKVHRPIAKAVIEDRIHRLRNEAGALEALLRALPVELPESADEGLYQIASNQHRW